MTDAHIDLDQEKVSFDGTWYTADELAARITEMLTAKDFRIGKAGAALETLQAALADARELTVRLPSSMLAAVETTAGEAGRSVGELVREALLHVIGGQLPVAEGADAAPLDADGASGDGGPGPRPAPDGAQPVPVSAVATEAVSEEEAANAVPLTPKKKDEPSAAEMDGSSWFDRDPQG
jgi:hypothetical protein